MDKPTRQQIERFWEWCGFKHHTYPEHWHFNHIEIYGARWIDPDKTGASIDTPELDLNNLFRYAIPKVGIDDGITFYEQGKLKWEVYFETAGGIGWGSIETEEELCDTPALALFWAIYKVMENDK